LKKNGRIRQATEKMEMTGLACSDPVTIFGFDVN
jgi:hypothetical protein